MAEPTYAHDPDCNTSHGGPEACPPPATGEAFSKRVGEMLEDAFINILVIGDAEGKKSNVRGILSAAKTSAILPVSREVWNDAQGLNAALGRHLIATDEERAARSEETRLKRAAVRGDGERVELTMDALLDKLGFSREYAEHLVQPYCDCGDTADGWDCCAHAQDEGVRRG